MTEKILRDILKQVPPDYYEKGIKNNFFQQWWHKSKWRELKKMLLGVSGKSLLDIGCADGTTTAQIKKFKPSLKINGIDYYKSAIVYARKRRPKIKFVVGDAHKLSFADKSFDVVCALETLEHLKDPKKVLSEIHRVLRSNGTLIIGQDTDNFLFKTIWFVWTRWKGSVWENSHINCMKPRELMKLVQKAGFEILTFEYINFGMEIFIKARKK